MAKKVAKRKKNKEELIELELPAEDYMALQAVAEMASTNSRKYEVEDVAVILLCARILKERQGKPLSKKPLKKTAKKTKTKK